METSDVKPLIGAPPEEKKVDLVELQKQLQFFRHYLHAATLRKERCEDLMSRQIAKTWDAKKKAKMVRRLTTANSELEQCVTAIDQVEHLIIDNFANKQPQLATADFVPAPPTSVAA